MEDARELRSLRDRPYELLRELDRRARAASQGQGDATPNGPEWVGIAFRLGGEAFLLAREETREVMSYPAAVTRVPGAKNWIRGLANLRGQLLPVIDVRAFLGSGATNVTRATRVLVANHREIPAGLVVDEVMGFRRFYEGSSRRTCRRRCSAASATWPAPSSAGPRCGPCSACATCSRASPSCRPRRRDARPEYRTPVRS